MVNLCGRSKSLNPRSSFSPPCITGTEVRFVRPAVARPYCRALASAVDELRPCIRRRQLESVRKPSIQACLQGVIGRVPLAGANVGWAKGGIEPDAPVGRRGFQSAFVVNL